MDFSCILELQRPRSNVLIVCAYKTRDGILYMQNEGATLAHLL